MSETTSLRRLSGLPETPASWRDQTLVLVDCQNTYTRGVLELDGVQQALDQVEELLDRARSAGVPVIHIQHDAGPGSPYDVRAESGAIVDRVAPRGDEPVVVKDRPNAFVGTDLEARCAASGRDVLLAGFMTHMCINSTARGAFNLGYRPTVVASATATRDLPGPEGTVPAAAVQTVSLAAIADLFGLVVPDGRAIPD
ncbi:cysteine hydrolase family protein [Geodermatophilus sp. SYSU D00815]